MFKRLHHVGIAVPDLDIGFETWGPAGIGLIEEGREDVTSAGTKVAMYPVGESRIELLEAIGEDTPIAKFLAKRGPGIHHLCFEVDDIEATERAMKAKGLETTAINTRNDGQRSFNINDPDGNRIEICTVSGFAAVT